MNWIYLFVAGLFEILFALSFGHLKNLVGTKLLLGSFVTLLCLVASLALLYFATKRIPIGIAYAVWTGIGAGGTVVASLIVSHEPIDLPKLLCLLLLVASIIGLRLTS